MLGQKHFNSNRIEVKIYEDWVKINIILLFQLI